jgi:hypothetical protein
LHHSIEFQCRRDGTGEFSFENGRGSLSQMLREQISKKLLHAKREVAIECHKVQGGFYVFDGVEVRSRGFASIL